MAANLAVVRDEGRTALAPLLTALWCMAGTTMQAAAAAAAAAAAGAGAGAGGGGGVFVLACTIIFPAIPDGPSV